MQNCAEIEMNCTNIITIGLLALKCDIDIINESLNGGGGTRDSDDI